MNSPEIDPRDLARLDGFAEAHRQLVANERIVISPNLAEKMKEPVWFRDANCRNSEIPSQYLEIMFPESNSGHGANHLATARKICLPCPVRYECLQYGLNDEYGVWGGHSPTQRKRITSLVKKGSSLLEASQQIDARSRDARRQ